MVQLQFVRANSASKLYAFRDEEGQCVVVKTDQRIRTGDYRISDFPAPGESVQLHWDDAQSVDALTLRIDVPESEVAGVLEELSQKK